MISLREWNKIQTRVFRAYRITNTTDVLLFSDRVRRLRCCDYLLRSYVENLMRIEAYMFLHFSHPSVKKN